MSFDDQLRELCARIRAAQDLEEVEKAGTELCNILGYDLQEHTGISTIPSMTASPTSITPAE